MGVFFVLKCFELFLESWGGSACPVPAVLVWASCSFWCQEGFHWNVASPLTPWSPRQRQRCLPTVLTGFGSSLGLERSRSGNCYFDSRGQAKLREIMADISRRQDVQKSLIEILSKNPASHGMSIEGVGRSSNQQCMMKMATRPPADPDPCPGRGWNLRSFEGFWQTNHMDWFHPVVRYLNKNLKMGWNFYPCCEASNCWNCATFVYFAIQTYCSVRVGHRMHIAKECCTL